MDKAHRRSHKKDFAVLALVIVWTLALVGWFTSRRGVESSSSLSGPLGDCLPLSRRRVDTVLMHACLAAAASLLHASLPSVRVSAIDRPCPYIINTLSDANTHGDNMIFLERLQEYEKIIEWSARLRKKHGRLPIILDVNAGTGSLSFPLAATGLHVWAFEASDVMATLFKRSLCHNPHLNDRIQLFEVGLQYRMNSTRIGDLGILFPTRSILNINVDASAQSGGLSIGMMLPYLSSASSPSFIRITCNVRSTASLAALKSDLTRLVSLGYELNIYKSDVVGLMHELALQRASDVQINLEKVA